MTPKDYKNLPERVTEQEILENWILSLVENNQPAEITKVNFIKTVKESQKNKTVKKIDKPKKPTTQKEESDE